MGKKVRMTFDEVLEALCGPRIITKWWDDKKEILTQAKLRWERELRERCITAIQENCQGEKEYGPHDYEAWWYREDQIEAAIMNTLPEDE